MLCAQGLHLSVPEIDFLINFYDNDGKGALNYDELVEALKGELTERRCVSLRCRCGCVWLSDVCGLPRAPCSVHFCCLTFPGPYR